MKKNRKMTNAKKPIDVKRIDHIMAHLDRSQDEFDAAMSAVRALISELGLAEYTEAVKGTPKKKETTEKQVSSDKNGEPVLSKKEKRKLYMRARRAALRKAAEEKKQRTEQPAEEAAPRVRHRTPSSARLTPHEITLNLGNFAVKELAERDAKEMLTHPNVFWYRTTLFPDPRRSKVQPSIEAVNVVKRNDPKFGSQPWTVNTTIRIEGDDKHAESWGLGVYNRNKAAQE